MVNSARVLLQSWKAREPVHYPSPVHYQGDMAGEQLEAESNMSGQGVGEGSNITEGLRLEKCWGRGKVEKC